MIYDFVYELNEIKIIKCKGWCGTCKVCDNPVEDKDIVWIKSFLNTRPFRICLDCWKKINRLVEEYDCDA